MCKFFSVQHHCCYSSLAIQGGYCSEKLDPWPDQIRMLHDKCLEEGHVQACGARCLLAMVWACLLEEHWADGYATSALQHWWADNGQYVCNRANLHEATASQYSVACIILHTWDYMKIVWVQQLEGARVVLKVVETWHLAQTETSASCYQDEILVS